MIPDCQDEELLIDAPRPDFWQYIKDLQDKGYTVAMHGYLHKYDSATHGIVNVTPRSEFAGHSYEEQLEKIKQGKAVLEQHGIFTDIFFAPAHSYDENTLKALRVNGFKYVSDGASSRTFVREGVLCYSVPCQEGAHKIGKKGYYTAVFHAHEWVRPERQTAIFSLKSCVRNIPRTSFHLKNTVSVLRGNAILQKLNEKGYLFYEYTVKPVLRPVVRPIKDVFQSEK